MGEVRAGRMASRKRQHGGCAAASTTTKRRKKAPDGGQQEPSSAYHGVYWQAPVEGRCTGCWKAQFCENKSKVALGAFDSEEDAARAHDAKAREVRGSVRPPPPPTPLPHNPT